ncbi:MAG: hypothetical protein JSS95_00035 [Acidobacteria bacterium]|nr:hypothetical protein [Acidobacteriota bacterium]
MIDKIELRLPVSTYFRNPVNGLLRRYRVARPSQHYIGVMDLRPHGFDAMLHYGKRREPHTHKLELFETGKKPYSELVGLVESIVEMDSSKFELTRIDLCADIPDVPVVWFHEHASFRYKRISRRVGKLKWDVISNTDIETITAGARPNVYRIYNKTAEELSRFRKAQRKQSRDADPLVFEQEYGHKETNMLTRIERQYGGGRLPKEVRTFGELHRAAEIDPFDAMMIDSAPVCLPRIEDEEFSEWLKGMALRHEAQARGKQEFCRWLNRHSKGNGARWMRRYAAYFPGSGERTPDKDSIRHTYQESTIRQLAA